MEWIEKLYDRRNVAWKAYRKKKEREGPLTADEFFDAFPDGDFEEEYYLFEENLKPCPFPYFLEEWENEEDGEPWSTVSQFFVVKRKDGNRSIDLYECANPPLGGCERFASWEDGYPFDEVAEKEDYFMFYDAWFEYWDWAYSYGEDTLNEIPYLEKEEDRLESYIRMMEANLEWMEISVM